MKTDVEEECKENKKRLTKTEGKKKTTEQIKRKKNSLLISPQWDDVTSPMFGRKDSRHFQV
jgi:hypothetical protein